jgi:hypothetical protein
MVLGTRFLPVRLGECTPCKSVSSTSQADSRGGEQNPNCVRSRNAAVANYSRARKVLGGGGICE